MPAAVEQLLRSVKTSDRVRASAWDAVYTLDDAAAEQMLRQLPLGDEVKAQLWEARGTDRSAARLTNQPTPLQSPGTAERGVPPQQFGNIGIETVSDEEWATLTPAQKAQGLLKAAGYGLSSMMGWGEQGREAVDRPGTTLALAALPAVVKGARAIPTRGKAAAKFQQVMGAVGNKPVDVSKPGDAALRIYQLSERGGAMPKVVRDFLKRATDPSKGEIEYREARDFYSNISRLSADEMKRLSPVIKRELGELRVALNDALAKTAASGGKERVYRAAMREYKIASKMREVAETVAKVGAGAVGAASALKIGKALLD